MTDLKLTKLEIKNFRHMKNVEVLFGDYLTVISGLNGTGKSSILGLTGHIFSFREKTKINSVRTISGNLFETEYSEIFKFCQEHDVGKDYEYKAFIKKDGEEIIKTAKSRYVESENRFRIDVGERKEGEGKITHPVIFLGLKRLFPIAQENEKDIHKTETNISDSEKQFYKNESDKVFISLRADITPQHINTKNKDFLCIETPNFGVKGNSAGQDNLGQILTSILSFKKLINPSKGILLIDELDTTFFPGSQINLVKRLYDYARKFNIQIIFTTHSLEIMKLLSERGYEGVKLNFLELRDNLVLNTVDPSFNYIRSRIMMETNQEEDTEKITLLCEDRLSELWCKNLIGGTDLKKIVEVYGADIPNTVLGSLASRNLPCFKNYIFVIDGESKSNSLFNKKRNILFLPGNRPPETVFYNFLNSLSDNDHFWGKNYFYKNTCFNGYSNETTLQKHKKWFQDKFNNFGKGAANLFSRWKENNSEEVNTFCESIRAKIKIKQH